MWQVELIGQWNAARRIPQIALDYQGLQMSETSGQPAQQIVPGTNLVSTLIICEVAVLEAIGADGNYQILWSEEIVNA